MRSLVVVPALLTLATPMLLGSAWVIVDQLRWDLRPVQRESRLLNDYTDGLRWLRETTPHDALLVAKPRLVPLISAYGERRVFYETVLFAAATHRVRWQENQWNP